MTHEALVLTPADPRWGAFAATLSAAIHKQGCCNDYRLAETIMSEMGGIAVADTIDFFQFCGRTKGNVWDAEFYDVDIAEVVPVKEYGGF